MWRFLGSLLSKTNRSKIYLAKSKKKNGKEAKELTLEQKLWESAEHLRGPVEAAEYKYIVLGFIFLKFVSDKFEQRRDFLKKVTNDPKNKEYYQKTVEARESIIEDVDFYQSENVFYIKKGSRWSDIMKSATQENIGLRIDKIMNEIEEDNPILQGVLPKVYGASNIPNENLTELINLFSSIGYGKTYGVDYDVLGRIYEYFIGHFALEEGRRKGEFYTPESVVKLIVEILKPYEGFVYDPTCGSGGMFVQSINFINSHSKNSKSNISIYGQEIKDGTWKLCKMNLGLRGIDTTNITLGDSLVNDKHPNLKANYVMANPPFNFREWGYDQLKTDKRWKYGIPSGSKAGGNYAFMQHMIYHLDEKNGKMGLVLANGSLSTTRIEGEIRQKIIEADLVDCMVALPSKLFFTVVISACLWFITKNKDDGKSRKRKGETLFIDAKNDFTKLDKAHNKLSNEQIEKIAGTYRSFIGEKGYAKYKDIPGYCKVATIEDISKSNFLLNPGRYVGAEEIKDDGEPFMEKMKRLTQEYVRLSRESQNIDKEIRKNLKGIGFEI